MELIASNIQVLLQAAEYLERRKNTETEHGYAFLSPYCGQSRLQPQRRPKLQPRKALRKLRSVHNELEKHRRAQLRHYLEQLKQQVPVSTEHEHARYTTLSLLHRARLHIKKLEEQEQRAQKLKERLRCEQQNLHQRLEELLAHSSVEHPQADSRDSSQFSSEHSDSDADVDVESFPFSSTEDGVATFSTGQEHSYSNITNVWI